MKKLITFTLTASASFHCVFADLKEEFMQALSSPTEWSKQKEKLNTALNNKEIGFYDLELNGKTFEGFDFSGMNFKGFYFDNCKFKNVNLEKSNLMDVYLYNSSFEGVKLHGATLAKGIVFDEKRSSPLELVKWYAELRTMQEKDHDLEDKAMKALNDALIKNPKYSDAVTWNINRYDKLIDTDENLKKLRKDWEEVSTKEHETSRKYRGLKNILDCMFKLDLAAKDLSNLNLSEIYLTEANLTGANLQGTTLSYAILKKANLTDVLLKDVNLSGASLGETRFSKDLVLAENSEEIFKQLKDSKGENKALFQKLISARYNFFRHVPNEITKDPNWKDFDLSHANLNYADLSEINLTGINLEGSSLFNATLRNTILVNANLKNTNLQQATFEKADLTGANLNNTEFTYANLTESNLTDVNLTEIKDVERAVFSKARLSKDYVLPDKCSTKVLEKEYNKCQDEKIKLILKFLASNVKLEDEYFSSSEESITISEVKAEEPTNSNANEVEAKAVK